MNVRHTLHQIKFEWDEKKSKANLRKHKVSFQIACEVFFDPFLRIVDAGVVEGESRAAVIGLTEKWRLLYVVFVERNETIRLLSARPVENDERRIYENQ